MNSCGGWGWANLDFGRPIFERGGGQSPLNTLAIIDFLPDTSPLSVSKLESSSAAAALSSSGPFPPPSAGPAGFAAPAEPAGESGAVDETAAAAVLSSPPPRERAIARPHHLAHASHSSRPWKNSANFARTSSTCTGRGGGRGGPAAKKT